MSVRVFAAVIAAPIRPAGRKLVALVLATRLATTGPALPLASNVSSGAVSLSAPSAPP